MAQGGSGFDLILPARLESCGSGAMGARTAVRLAGDMLPRWRCTGEGDPGDIGLDLRRGLVMEHHRGTCIPRAGSDKRCRAGNRDFGWCGGTAVEVLAGAGCWCRAGVSSGRKEMGTKVRVCARSERGTGRAGLRCRASATAELWRRGAGVRCLAH